MSRFGSTQRTTRRRRATVALAAGALAVSALAVAPAAATFQGVNGRIFFEQGKNVYSVDPDGTDKDLFLKGAWFPGKPNLREPVPSPNGAKIAVSAGGSDIYVVNVSGSKVVNVTGKISDQLTLTHLQFPAWSPTGKTLVFQAVAFKNGGYVASIYRINLDKTGFKKLAALPGYWGTQESRPEWGSSGRIAFSLGVDLWTMNPDGSVKTNLTKCDPASEDCGFTHPSWSPDGTQIAVDHEVDGDMFENQPGIVTVDAMTGSVLTVITGNENVNESYESPSWSPDGAQIVFHGYQNGDGTTDDLYVATVQNNAPTTKLDMSNTFDDIDAQNPAWSVSPQIP